MAFIIKQETAGKTYLYLCERTKNKNGKTKRKVILPLGESYVLLEAISKYAIKHPESLTMKE